MHETAVAHLRAADPVLADVIAQVGACTLAAQRRGFFTLVDSIISQQISVQAAASVLARVERELGEITPQAILARSASGMRGLGLSGQKASYLLSLAEHTANGGLDFAAFAEADDEAVIANLTQVRGIGRWTAEMFLIFDLGRPDILPVDDLGLRVAVQQRYGLAAQPRPNELRQLAEPWRPYRSVATWYLWRSRRL